MVFIYISYLVNFINYFINFFFQEELLSLKTIPKSLAVFCLATYGEGDPTDNAMEFWDWIQGDVDLTGLNYAVSIHIFFFLLKSQDFFFANF